MAAIILSLLLGWWPQPCAGDANGDRVVNILDLSLISAHYLQAVAPGTTGDLNGDGVVNALDLVIVGQNYGHICTVTIVPGLAVDGD